MSFASLNFLVLWRYRSLIPLMLALMVMQQFFICMVQTMHPLTPITTRTPPGLRRSGSRAYSARNTAISCSSKC